MVGDYNSTSFLDGKAYPVFASASAPSGSTFNESMYTAPAGLTVAGGGVATDGGSASPASPASAQPVTAR